MRSGQLVPISLCGRIWANSPQNAVPAAVINRLSNTTNTSPAYWVTNSLSRRPVFVSMADGYEGAKLLAGTCTRRCRRAEMRIVDADGPRSYFHFATVACWRCGAPTDARPHQLSNRQFDISKTDEA